jgi:hypothetical protein
MTAPTLLAKARADQTRERPDATQFAVGGACQICLGTDLTWGPDGMSTPVTYSRQPNSDGLHSMQGHHGWCPVVDTTRPAISCPHCGAGVDTYEYRPGYTLEVPSPIGGTDHLVGTADEIFGAPDARWTDKSPQRNSSFDEMTVSPCGHTLEGDDVRTVLRAAAKHRASQRVAEVEATLAEHADLLAAVEASGASAVADRYREALQAGSADAAGLLAAMRALDAAL